MLKSIFSYVAKGMKTNMSTKYQTKLGDTFDSIAFSLLGDEKYTRELMEANPDYLEVVIFSGGIDLTIPDISNANNISGSMPPWRKES
jgi:phage tail protein X